MPNTKEEPFQSFKEIKPTKLQINLKTQRLNFKFKFQNLNLFGFL